MNAVASPVMGAEDNHPAGTERGFPFVPLAGLLGAATLAAYHGTIRNSFVDFDDPSYVTQNDHVRTGLNWANIRWAFQSTEAANWHPVTWLSHMLDCQLFGLNAAAHHAVSAGIHATNAILLFLLLDRATGFRWRSLCVAALFALHPLNVQTVAWAAERKSILCMFFSLLMVAAYGWYVKLPKPLRYLAVSFCFALALLSKPMAVTIPILLLLLDYWPLRRLPIPGGDRKDQFGACLGKLFLEKLPLFAMSAASSLITVVAQRRGHAISTMQTFPLSQRLENAVWAYTQYIVKMFWPSRLAYIYPHTGNTLPAAEVCIRAALLVGATLLAWRLRERRYIVFGWGLFLMSLLPVIGIVQVGLQAMADRYAYLPLIGLFVIVVWLAHEALSRFHVPRLAQAAAALVVAGALAVTTSANVANWRNNLTLFTHAHDVTSPPYFQIELNLGAALSDAGRTSDAILHFQNAERLGPDLFIPHFDIGYLLAQGGNNHEAVAELQQAVQCARNDKERARALNVLAVAYLDLKNDEQASAAFSRLLAIQPQSVAGLAGRGQAYFNMARYREAGQDFSEALKETPAPELMLMAGKSLEAAGQPTEAAAYYRQALESNPNLSEARTRLDSLTSRLRGQTHLGSH
jgi:tetratricopeptide (TPR) repeat protein